MSQDLKAGSRWRSAVCDTEVVVVRAPSEPAQLECGGTPMLPVGSDPEQGSSPDPQWSDGTLIGKRYELNAPAIEILCTKAGARVTLHRRRATHRQGQQAPPRFRLIGSWTVSLH